MDKRNFPEVGSYDTSTFYFFLVFWDTLGDTGLDLRSASTTCQDVIHYSMASSLSMHIH